ncbi:MAG: hypothetical protein CVU73_15880 [Deltaproteobacteria bacterium HGW-Deltaproteobacteria-8]|jgi:hypothetical protein|nr:MAG: hypothetical protein CVU73_15880 [Deltaproteobacteria bacterium HGW-Deltaproteobacteria-8]
MSDMDKLIGFAFFLNRHQGQSQEQAITTALEDLRFLGKKIPDMLKSPSQNPQSQSVDPDDPDFFPWPAP